MYCFVLNEFVFYDLFQCDTVTLLRQAMEYVEHQVKAIQIV